MPASDQGRGLHTLRMHKSITSAERETPGSGPGWWRRWRRQAARCRGGTGRARCSGGRARSCWRRGSPRWAAPPRRPRRWRCCSSSARCWRSSSPPSRGPARWGMFFVLGTLHMPAWLTAAMRMRRLTAAMQMRRRLNIAVMTRFILTLGPRRRRKVLVSLLCTQVDDEQAGRWVDGFEEKSNACP